MEMIRIVGVLEVVMDNIHARANGVFIPPVSWPRPHPFF